MARQAGYTPGVTSKKARDRDRRANERMREEARQQLRDGRPDRARRLLKAVISNHGANARYWYDLGRLEAGEGNTEEAASAFGRALDLSPDYASAQRALDELGVPRPAAHVEPEDAAPEPPESLLATEPHDWEATLEALKKIGGAALPGLVDVDRIAALHADLGGRPGMPLEEEGASEHLLTAPPPSVAPLVEELVFRGRVLNRSLRALLSGPTPPAAANVLGAAGVLSLDKGMDELRWPRAVGESPFPVEVALPLAGPLRVEVSDAVGGKKGKLRRPLEAAPGDALILCAGERAVHIGGVWGRQGLIVRVIGGAEQHVLRVRVG